MEELLLFCVNTKIHRALTFTRGITTSGLAVTSSQIRFYASSAYSVTILLRYNSVPRNFSHLYKCGSPQILSLSVIVLFNTSNFLFKNSSAQAR